MYLSQGFAKTFIVLGDTATNLGTAMDELMRHQPTLRQDAMTAIIKVSEDSRTSLENDLPSHNPSREFVTKSNYKF